MSNYRIEVVNHRIEEWDTTRFVGAATDNWFWRIVAANGKTLAHSETYSSKAQCVKTARKVADDWGIELVEK